MKRLQYITSCSKYKHSGCKSKVTTLSTTRFSDILNVFLVIGKVFEYFDSLRESRSGITMLSAALITTDPHLGTGERRGCNADPLTVRRIFRCLLKKRRTKRAKGSAKSMQTWRAPRHTNELSAQVNVAETPSFQFTTSSDADTRV